MNSNIIIKNLHTISSHVCIQYSYFSECFVKKYTWIDEVNNVGTDSHCKPNSEEEKNLKNSKATPILNCMYFFLKKIFKRNIHC